MLRILTPHVNELNVIVLTRVVWPPFTVDLRFEAFRPATISLWSHHMIDNQAPHFVPFEVSTMHIHQQLPTTSLDNVTERPASVPLVDRSALQLASRDVKALRTSRVASESTILMTGKQAVAPLDLMGNLKRAEPSVVKTRTGSVLSRGFILKTDYYPSGSLDYH